MGLQALFPGWAESLWASCLAKVPGCVQQWGRAVWWTQLPGKVVDLILWLGGTVGCAPVASVATFPGGLTPEAMLSSGVGVGICFPARAGP